MVMVIFFQQPYFLHKIYSNALLFEHVLIGGNEKL